MLFKGDVCMTPGVMNQKSYHLWRIHTASCPAKSVERLGRVAWLSNLNIYLPSGFITSNKTNRLHHPVRLNIGKHQRKASWLCSLEGLCMHFDCDYQYQKMEWTNKDVVILHYVWTRQVAQLSRQTSSCSAKPIWLGDLRCGHAITHLGNGEGVLKCKKFVFCLYLHFFFFFWRNNPIENCSG